jgi:hypothetical protein
MHADHLFRRPCLVFHRVTLSLPKRRRSGTWPVRRRKIPFGASLDDHREWRCAATGEIFTLLGQCSARRQRTSLSRDLLEPDFGRPSVGFDAHSARCFCPGSADARGGWRAWMRFRPNGRRQFCGRERCHRFRSAGVADSTARTMTAIAISARHRLVTGPGFWLTLNVCVTAAAGR